MPMTFDLDRFTVGVFPSSPYQSIRRLSEPYHVPSLFVTSSPHSDQTPAPDYPSPFSWCASTDSGVRNALLFGSDLVLFAVERNRIMSAQDEVALLRASGVVCFDGYQEFLASIRHFDTCKSSSPNTDLKNLLFEMGRERAQHVEQFRFQRSLERYDFQEMVAEYARFSCQATLGDSLDRPATQSWTPWQGVAGLQQAVQKICLPDISSLPIAEILEIRTRCENLLIPMRAELLRLSKCLRIMGESGDILNIAKEAESTVYTEILPTVLEASTLIKEELRKRDKNFAYRALRFIGIAGLIHLYPDAVSFIPVMIEKVIDTLEAGQESLTEPRPVAYTARFVLQVHDALDEIVRADNPS